MAEVSKSPHKLTVDEYLQAEEVAVQRGEFLDGEVFAVPATSDRHERIRANLLAAIEPLAARDPGKTLHTDLRLYVARYAFCTHPDLVVLSGPPETYQGHTNTVTDAFIIAEVLSASSEPFDRGEKFKSYRALPSLHEYMLVSQDQARVEHFRRTDTDDWASNDICGRDWEIVVSGLQGLIRLTDLYRGIEF